MGHYLPRGVQLALAICEAFNKNEEDNNMSENKTLKNLMAAFTGEAEANRKYTAYFW